MSCSCPPWTPSLPALGALQHPDAGAGRPDLDDYADDIARVSLAATPFIGTYLTGVMAQTRPGHLVVTTLAAPGSVAAAHLNFMLAGQAGAAALPRAGELEADLAAAGFAGIAAQPIVPAGPFLAVRAVLR